jgi:hypothetical protein
MNQSSSSEKRESLAFVLNLIYSFFLVLIQSASLGIIGFGIMYWAGVYAAYFLVLVISSAAPIGFAGIWYFYAKGKFKKMYLFYLLPLILYSSSYFLFEHLAAKVSQTIPPFEQDTQEEPNSPQEE